MMDISDLTTRQRRLLRLIYNHGAQSLSELQDRELIDDASDMTPLEDAGLVCRAEVQGFSQPRWMITMEAMLAARRG